MKRYVNLMTDQSLRKIALRQHSRVWLFALPMLLGLLAIPVFVRWQAVQPLADRRLALVRRYEPARKTQDENKLLNSKIDAMLTEERLAILLAEQRPMAVLMGVVSQAASSEGMQLRIEKFELRDRNPDETLQTGRRGTLNLRGIAASSEDVGRFVAALRQPPFQSVELETTERKKIKSFELESFAIRCDY